MEIYLLQFKDGSVAFYSEGRDSDASIDSANEAPKKMGAGRFVKRTRIERAWAFLRKKTQGGETAKDNRTARVWRWLQKFSAPDEKLLQRLRLASDLTLYYPASMNQDAAFEVWRDYLKKRERFHLFRLAANGLITPLTLLLTPLPGPNVIGYWFAYRAVCHFLAARGIRRARDERETKLKFEASNVLNETFATSERLAHLAAHFNLKRLNEFVERLGVENEAKPAAPCIAP